MLRKTFIGAVLVAGLAIPGGAMAADPANGEKVFNACKACHTLDGKHRVGPSLQGLIGRPAGTAQGFKYSDAMTKSGITWDGASLATYLADPKGSMPGNKMAYAGVKSETNLADLIAYLETAAK